MNDLNRAIDFLLENIPFNPKVAIILGSGLGEYADTISDAKYLNYSDIPGFCVSTAPSHKGRLVFARIEGVNTVFLQGRLHCYEGLTPEQTVIPIRALIKCGAEYILATCAVGGINKKYFPGTLALVTDHINFSGLNPLSGKNLDDFGPRFCDMSKVYNEQINELLENKCSENNLKLEHGIYGYMTGPSYETPAEINALKVLGADMVGMSLVMESTAAAHAGVYMNCVACITNMAAGILEKPLDLQEVIDVGKQNAHKLVCVIENYIKIISLSSCF